MKKVLQKIFIPIGIFAVLLAFSMKTFSAGEGEAIPFQLKQESMGKWSPQALNARVAELLVQETNEIRAKKKLAALTVNSILEKASLDHSRDMLKRHYLSHFSPEGKSVVERVGRYVPAVHTSVGENLHTIQSGKGLSDPQAIAHLMMEDWMHSPSHRDNIIAKKFTQVGVGCVSDGFQIYCTQVFSGANL